MSPSTGSSKPTKASRLGAYFHLPSTPVPTLPSGTTVDGVWNLEIVQPLADKVAGGLIVQTRPSPHHSLWSPRFGSNSRPQFWMLTLLLDITCGNSPLASVGVK